MSIRQVKNEREKDGVVVMLECSLPVTMLNVANDHDNFGLPHAVIRQSRSRHS